MQMDAPGATGTKPKQGQAPCVQPRPKALEGQADSFEACLAAATAAAEAAAGTCHCEQHRSLLPLRWPAPEGRLDVLPNALELSCGPWKYALLLEPKQLVPQPEFRVEWLE